MDDDELKSWVDEQLSSGYTKQEIEDSLLDKGVDRNRIKDALPSPQPDSKSQGFVNQPATLRPRANAEVLDNVIALFGFAAIQAAATLPILMTEGAGPTFRGSNIAETVAVAGALFALMFQLFGYKALLEARNGRTFGKRLVGIRVKSEDGSDVTGRQALVRSITLAASAVLTGYLAAIIPILIGDTNKRIGDELASTQVVEG